MAHGPDKHPATAAVAAEPLQFRIRPPKWWKPEWDEPGDYDLSPNPELDPPPTTTGPA